MSLCCLIHNNTLGISSAKDLIQIMNIGNQLYSSLSQLARQAYLMQPELPAALNVVDTDYQLEYSESYSGAVHEEVNIEGYQYSTSLQRSFESLISESYTNFILTVRWIAVTTFCNCNVWFKIFDSHARDLHDRGQPQSICVLLVVPHCIYTEWRHLDNSHSKWNLAIAVISRLWIFCSLSTATN